MKDARVRPAYLSRDPAQHDRRRPVHARGSKKSSSRSSRRRISGRAGRHFEIRSILLIIGGGVFSGLRNSREPEVIKLFKKIIGPGPLPPRCGHSPKNFLSRWTTSGGCVITSLANDSSSSPATGSTGHPRFFASAKNSASLTVLFHASRKILTRSAGTPGGVTWDDQRYSLPRITVASRRLISGVLYWSISS